MPEQSPAKFFVELHNVETKHRICILLAALRLTTLEQSGRPLTDPQGDFWMSLQDFQGTLSIMANAFPAMSQHWLKRTDGGVELCQHEPAKHRQNLIWAELLMARDHLQKTLKLSHMLPGVSSSTSSSMS